MDVLNQMNHSTSFQHFFIFFLRFGNTFLRSKYAHRWKRTSVIVFFYFFRIFPSRSYQGGSYLIILSHLILFIILGAGCVSPILCFIDRMEKEKRMEHRKSLFKGNIDDIKVGLSLVFCDNCDKTAINMLARS